MNSLRLAPSEQFLEVLEELHSLPDAPKNIAKYFNKSLKKRNVKNKSDSDVSKGKKYEEENSKVEEIEEQVASDSKEEKDTVDVSLHFPDHRKSLLLNTKDIKWCHSKLSEKGIKKRIHELISSSEILLPQIVPEKRNPELQERVKKLRAQQENMEYQRMTGNLRHQIGYENSWSDVGKEVREMHSEVNRQMVAGLQYLVSIVGTFFALFIGMGFYNAELITRLLTALIAAAIVAVAELYFIIREDIRAETMVKKK